MYLQPTISTTSRIGSAMSLENSDLVGIILCGIGANLAPLTQGTPKALLPIAGRPLLSRALHWIESASIRDILVIATHTGSEAIASYLKTIDSSRRPELVVVDDHLGSAQALFRIRDRPGFRRHALVMAVDAIPSESLYTLIDQFRIHEAAVLALYFETSAPASGTHLFANTDSNYHVGLCALGAASQEYITPASTIHRLVYNTPGSSTKKASMNGLPLRMDMMRKFANVRLQCLVNAHVFLIQQWALDALFNIMNPKNSIPIPEDSSNFTDENQVDENQGNNPSKAFTSLQRDLISLLVKAQYSSSAQAMFTTAGSEHSSKDEESHTQKIHTENTPEIKVIAVVTRAVPLTEDHAVPEPNNAGVGSGAVNPCSIVGTPGIRATSFNAYIEANRAYGRLMHERVAPSAIIGPRAQVGPESLVGDLTSLGERCSIKKSVVGAHCSLGRNVKLVGCVIMDKVVLEDDVKLEGCIVGPAARIGEKAFLKDSVVSGRVSVPRDVVIRNERFGG